MKPSILNCGRIFLPQKSSDIQQRHKCDAKCVKHLWHGLSETSIQRAPRRSLRPAVFCLCPPHGPLHSTSVHSPAPIRLLLAYQRVGPEGEGENTDRFCVVRGLPEPAIRGKRPTLTITQCPMPLTHGSRPAVRARRDQSRPSIRERLWITRECSPTRAADAEMSRGRYSARCGGISVWMLVREGFQVLSCCRSYRSVLIYTVQMMSPTMIQI